MKYATIYAAKDVLMRLPILLARLEEIWGEAILKADTSLWDFQNKRSYEYIARNSVQTEWHLQFAQWYGVQL